MITPGDLEGVEDSLARRIIAMARSITPGLDNLVDQDGGPELRTDAIAILIGVAGVVADRGSLFIKQQVMGPARVTYQDIDTWFSPDDRAALRALVAVGNTTFNPLGNFPHKDHHVDRLFRERPFWLVEERD